MLTAFQMGCLSLMNFDYAKSLDCFQTFSKSSKWSKSFNIYIVVLLRGCLNDDSDLKTVVANSMSINTRRNFIEKFSKNRLAYLNELDRIGKDICEFLAIELLYFLLCIPYCNARSLNAALESKFLN